METLLTPVVGSIRDAVVYGDIVIVRRRKMSFIRGLICRLNPFKREEVEVSKLITPKALALLVNELEGAELLRRVRATGEGRIGAFAYIVPLDNKGRFVICQGVTEERAMKKARRSRYFPNGGLFRAIDKETIAEIIKTAESP